ncbi:DUF1428 domain-containing protein [Arenibacterium halophilum]|uniref:DUF1428 domain-containing protein n=1 Tax=Arenibacterium halophilum TaxID=2583821 RepID=A0ABY2X604_9RHOB|nr:DUF1428 domain-containing protein [Arenibacterium halophilum]TMV10878.1 DUF1428 domain-containing protein [Arenibacterium halophilum]
MKYVDGFVMSVPTAKKQDFIDMARRMAPVFKEFGVLEVVDCWGVDVPEGKVTSFPMAVKATADETVCFGWMVWPSKAVRDENFQKIMDDPRCQPGEDGTPFDGKRMIFGGFDMVSVL